MIVFFITGTFREAVSLEKIPRQVFLSEDASCFFFGPYANPRDGVSGPFLCFLALDVFDNLILKTSGKILDMLADTLLYED